MTLRENYLAALSYRPYEKLPVIRFGHWPQTLHKWHREGHITKEELLGYDDGNIYDYSIGLKQGFDFPICYNRFFAKNQLFPPFEEKIVEELPDGSKKKLNAEGAIIVESVDAYSIPTHVGHTLVDRNSFEEHYRFRLQFTDNRIDFEALDDIIKNPKADYPSQLYLGSFFGAIRNLMGIEGVSYLYADDEELYDELIFMMGDLVYRIAERIFEYGYRPDVCSIWEDICFKNGPLVVPAIFKEKVGPHYKRVCDLCKRYGVTIIYLDCDGVIDALLPIWLENGVNTMFSIEVGTWGGSIKPWREQYGRAVRGIGGINKHVLAMDRAAIDTEVERMKQYVDLGGFIPCLDHHITPQASWDNVRYYCDRMHAVFG